MLSRVAGIQAASPDGQGGAGDLAQINGRGNRPVVGGQRIAAAGTVVVVGLGVDHARAAVGIVIVSVVQVLVVGPVVAVAVSVHEGPVVRARLEVPGIGGHDGHHGILAGVGILGNVGAVFQGELVQLGCAGAAVAGSVEHAVVVDGKTVHLAAGVAVQGHNRDLGELAGDEVHLVDGVVIAQQIQVVVGVVEGHVVDITRVDGAAHAGGLVQSAQLGGVHIAVVGRHEDIAVHVLRRGDGEVHVGVVAQTGIGAVAVVVPQGVLVDLPGAVAAAGSRGGASGDKADHQAAVVLFLTVAAQVDLEGGLVAGIVANQQHDLTLGQGHALGQLQGNLNQLVGAGLLGHALHVDLGAGLVHHGHVGNVAVVLRADGDVAGDEVHQSALDLGSGVIHGDGVLDAGAVAQDAGFNDGGQAGGVQRTGGGNLAVLLGVDDAVVLGQGIEANGNDVALLHTGRGQLLTHVVVGGGGVLPGAAVDVVVSAVLLGGRGLGKEDLALGVLDREAQGGHVPDVQIVEGVDGGLAVQGQPLDGELVLDHVGVAHVGGDVAVSVLHAHVVARSGGGDVGFLGGTVGNVNGAAAVQHGGIRPGAAVAQDGDGVDDVQHALFIGNGIHVGVALDEEALGEVAAQEQSLPALVDLQIDGDLGGLGDGDNGGSGRLKDQSGVHGGDDAVAVHVGSSLVKRGVLSQLAGQLVQDGLGVSLVGLAVHVDVGVQSVGVLVDLAVDLIGGNRADAHGAGVLQHTVTGVAGHSLGEQIGTQGEGLGALHGVNGEGVLVLADAVGIVAQLNLDLAVLGSVGEEGGVLVHQDVRLGSGGVGHVAETGAHTEGGPVLAVLVKHGMSGGHQQGVDQLTLAQAGLGAQVIVPDVLPHDSGHTGNLRRSHGGTGHDLVVGVGLGGAAGGSVGAPDGVDGAAGSQNLRLHAQGARRTVGGEGGNAHGVGDLGNLNLDLAGDAHGAGVVLLVALDLLGGSLDGVAVGLQDGDSGSGVVVAGEVHVDDAVSIVDDDDADSTLGHGGVGLREEGGGAAVAHGNLAGQDLGADGHELVTLLAHVVVVVHAGAVHQDVLILPAGDGGNGRIAVAGGLGVENVAVAEDQGTTGLAHVVHGGNGQGVGEGAGAAAGGVVHVVDVQVGIPHGGVVGGVVPHTAVARGEGHHSAVLNQLVHGVFITAGEAEAGGAGAEGQVGGVAAQDDGVLDGDNVIGVVGAAADAEDLHDDDLGVRGNTLGADGLESGNKLAVDLDEAVGCGNAFHVGAVLTLGVLHVLDVIHALVNVVVAVGDLGVAVSRSAGTDGGVQLALDSVDLVGSQQIQAGNVFIVGHSLFFGGLGQGVFQGLAGEGLVLTVDTGIDDGNLAAGAGITVGPGDVGADHVGGGAVVGLVSLLVYLRLIAILQEHVLDTVDGLDGLDLSVEHVRRDVVGRKSQIPLDVQLAADDLLDLGSHSLLFFAETRAVGPGSGISRVALGLEAGIQSGGLLQDDGHTNDIRAAMGRFLIGFLFSALLTGFQCAGVDGDEIQFPGLAGSGCFLDLLCADGGNHHRQNHSHNQYHRQDPAEQRCVLHCHISF